MKKLMIAAAIVCAAVMSQAASIMWNTTDLYGSNGEYISDNISDSGYSYSAVVTIAALGDSTGTRDWDSFSGSYDNAELSTGYTATLVVSEYKGGQLVATLTGSGSFTSGETESFAKTLDFSDGSGFLSGSYIGDGDGKWQTVPEPTSGLLLLLGVAGLALRRRRA